MPALARDVDPAAGLLTNALWHSKDLGRPIPESPHAVSVCLPTWRDNVGYEEGEPRVVDRLQAGYPRFVFHPLCRQLFDDCRSRFGRGGEACLAFPTGGSAARFAEWMSRRARAAVRGISVGTDDVRAVFFDAEKASEARAFWQHTGEGISSRLAVATLEQLEGRTAEEGTDRPIRAAGDEAKRLLRKRIATRAAVSSDDVFLFPCGMNAAWQLHRAVLRGSPGRRSAQFGFPYVDTLKILQKEGPGAAFFPRGDAADLDALRRLTAAEPLAAIYTELPSNPLLLTPDLSALADLARDHRTLLIVDDTIGSSVNVDALPVADVVWMSLTKFFSGIGNVTGGAVVLNPRSRSYDWLRTSLASVYADLLHDGDALVLERNSRDYESRVRTINANAEWLADFLHDHPRVAAVHYPKFRTPELYRARLRAGGGYGGLLSIELKDAARAEPFFDALRVSKGPNLGMSYSLACPYTILAHYGELAFAESCGVSRHLVRVSVGTEDPDDLMARFGEALDATARQGP